jgi:hypothetical protein
MLLNGDRMAYELDARGGLEKLDGKLEKLFCESAEC